MPRVYERTSGFIHLSNKHIFTTIDLLDEAGKAEIVIRKSHAKILWLLIRSVGRQ